MSHRHIDEYDARADMVRLVALRQQYDEMRRRHEMLLQLQALLSDLPSFMLQAPSTAQSFEEAMIRRAIFLSLIEAQEKPSGPPPITDVDLARLREFTVSSQDIIEDCTVCLDPMKPSCRVVELPCRHRFCRGCAHEWLKLHRTCPNCRCEVDFESQQPPPLAPAAALVPPAPPPPPRRRDEPSIRQRIEARIEEHVVIAPRPVPARAALPAPAPLAAQPPPAPPMQPIPEPPERLTNHDGYQRLVLVPGSGIGNQPQRQPSRANRLRGEIAVFRTYDSGSDDDDDARIAEIMRPQQQQQQQQGLLAPLEAVAQRRRERQLEQQRLILSERRAIINEAPPLVPPRRRAGGPDTGADTPSSSSSSSQHRSTSTRAPVSLRGAPVSRRSESTRR